jgi:hypothetical protein
MPRTTRNAPRGATPTGPEGALRFSLFNWIFLAAGMLAVVAGFWLLAGGSTVAAPLVLMLGYLVLIPIGIIK